MSAPLFLAWVEYHVRTEEFDRGLPGAFHPRDPDNWLPRFDHHDRSVRNAKETKALIAYHRRVEMRGRASNAANDTALRMSHRERVGCLRYYEIDHRTPLAPMPRPMLIALGPAAGGNAWATAEAFGPLQPRHRPK